MKKTHRSMFLKEVKEAFPELITDINSEYGLLHLEMHVFHEFVQSKIINGDEEKVKKAFQIIAKHFHNGNHKLVNAIGVSFLEHLDFGVDKTESNWAYALLPNSLREPYKQLKWSLGSN